METIRQICGTCSGMGKVVNWKNTNEVEGIYKKNEEECCTCGGNGYIEYAVFSVEEAQAILKYCGIIADEIGDI